MALQGKAPLALMGSVALLACLSKKTRSFFDYFYQLFAQVTNPPIDALREHMVTSTTLYLGNHGNLLEDSRTACQLVRLERPLLSEEEFDRICAIDRVGFKTRRFRAVYRRDAGEGALQAALKQLAEDVEAAVRDGVNIVVLLAVSDSGKPIFDEELAKRVSALDIPCFACPPERLPEVLENALKRRSLAGIA